MKITIRNDTNTVGNMPECTAFILIIDPKRVYVVDSTAQRSNEDKTVRKVFCLTDGRSGELFTHEEVTAYPYAELTLYALTEKEPQ